MSSSYILAHHFNIKLMSKTYEMYLNKAQTLIDGLKKNLNVVSDYGINQEDLRKLEQAVQEAGKLNEDVDRRRAELNLVVPQANKKLAEIKVAMNDMKRIVKHRVDPLRWTDFGVLDKTNAPFESLDLRLSMGRFLLSQPLILDEVFL